MDLEQIEIRMNQISELLDTPEANLEELEKEIRSLKEQKSMMLADIERRKAEEKAVIESATIVEEFKEEKKTMELREFLNSDAYVNAYANYIKTGSDREIRTLATETYDGEDESFTKVPIPTYLADRINTAWERNELIRRIPKTYFKGNYREVFELSATGAEFHTEGGEAPAEEQLEFGVVEIVNQNIKKWIKVTDELMSLKGRAFLDYLYDEIEYQIAKAVEDYLIMIVARSTEDNTATSIGVPVVNATDGHYAEAIIEASGKLSPEAKPVLVMDRSTWATIKVQALSANYAYDPFNGYEVIFVNANAPLLVGFLLDPEAFVINLPDGNEPTIKVDELSLAEYDIVKIVGKQMVGVGLVKPGRVVIISKSNDEEGGTLPPGGDVNS